MRVFDGHCDTLSRCWRSGQRFRENDGHLDLKRLGSYSAYAQFFAVFWDRGREERRPMWPIFQAQRELLVKELEENSDRMVLCATAEDCDAAWEQGKIAAFLSVEGGELLNCDPALLGEAHRLGVRAVNITWNHANALSGSNIEAPDKGLTAQGKDFVREMDRLGMLVDVSHLSDPGFWNVARLVKGPIFASHSDSRAVHFHPRNLTDEQFTAIIDSQGVAGLNLCPPFLGEAPNLDTIVDHLEHFLALGGEDCVALGGDWDGVRSLPDGISDVTGWAALHQRLEELGYAQTLLDKLFYKNLMRVVSKVCTM